MMAFSSFSPQFSFLKTFNGFVPFLTLFSLVLVNVYIYLFPLMLRVSVKHRFLSTLVFMSSAWWVFSFLFFFLNKQHF